MAETYITNEKLAEELGISLDELTRIEDYFDEIPDDEWELVQGKDYKVINGKGTREYTQDGAYTIARYLEATKTLGFFEKIREWFTGYRKKIRQSFVRQKITDNCSSLVKRGDRFWVSRADAKAIFGTRSDYLTKMAEQTQKTEYPLIKGADYEDFVNDGGLHFSLSGIEKLSRVFSENLTRKNRREECKDVGEVIHTQVKSLVDKIIDREKRITKVCKYVKEDRDKNKCLVTGKKKHRNSNFDLAAHHLYSKGEYPHIADCSDNLITITQDVHRQFHDHFMGGKDKPCTPDDFIKFVHQYYPENSEVITWLNSQKLKLGTHQPSPTRKPHVLYLPASKVS